MKTTMGDSRLNNLTAIAEFLKGSQKLVLNNLRQNPIYKSYWINGTKSREVKIGKTSPSVNNHLPGSIRVDTVHQRDVFHINAVDKITQWEIVVCVPQISERFLAPVLELLLDQFPFVVFNFHSDRDCGENFKQAFN